MLVAQHCGTVLREVDAGEIETLPQRLTRLTPKEGTTLRHLAHGIAPVKIAAMQNIGLGTVKTYLQNIYGKLEVKGQLPAAYTGVVAQMVGLLPLMRVVSSAVPAPRSDRRA